PGGARRRGGQPEAARPAAAPAGGRRVRGGARTPLLPRLLAGPVRGVLGTAGRATQLAARAHIPAHGRVARAHAHLAVPDLVADRRDRRRDRDRGGPGRRLPGSAHVHGVRGGERADPPHLHVRPATFDL